MNNAPPRSPLSFFEFWPGWLFYTPIVAYWIALGLWYRDLGLSSAANPRIPTGGLCGESKSAILDLAGPLAQSYIAPYTTLVTGVDSPETALEQMQKRGITLPVVVKPDIGCNGTGIKLARNEAELRSCLPLYPGGVRLLLQQLVPYEEEAGIFYMRSPDAAEGRLTSLTYKETPVLMGDGRSTLWQLLCRDARTRLLFEIYVPRLRHRLAEILAPGESIRLVFAGNHCKGSVFHDGRADITPELSARIDSIMRDIPDFHFGRLDVKFRSRQALQRGEGFQIIEINGIGSEAIHIWDRSTTLKEAYATQFMHYREAFRIGAQMRAAGWKPTGAFMLLKYWRLQRKLLASYPLND